MRKTKLIKLVEQMKKGDESAFNELYMEFKDPLYFIAFELTKNEADAKDAVQDTFIQIQCSIAKLNEPKVFVLWMKRILLSKCYDIFRSNKRLIFNDEMVENLLDSKNKQRDKTVEKFRFHNDQEIIHSLLTNLTYVQQEVITLYYLDQMKIREIADVLRISEGTVKSRMNAGKVALRQQVEQYERIHGEKLNFHAKSIGALITSYYAMQYTKGSIGMIGLLKTKVNGLFAQSPMILVGTGVLATTAIVAIAAPYIGSMQEAPFQQLSNNAIENNITDQKAYFLLRQWAHCKDEMEKKSSDEFSQIYPYYLQLKDNNGRYYKALEVDHWAQDFISFIK